ncbi:hypothetical protein ACHAXH_008536 [Discostella pseudostelligera]
MGNNDSKKKPPPPTVLAAKGNICLRGKLVRNTSDEISLDKPAPIHHISGLWAMEGLSKILDEPDNGGYYNVKGQGRNEFGKYTVTGTLMDFTITLSRVYQVPKEKATKKSPAIDNNDGGGVHCNDEVISISSDDSSEVEDVTGIYLAKRNEELQKMFDDAELIDDAECLKEENESLKKTNAEFNTRLSHTRADHYTPSSFSQKYA